MEEEAWRSVDVIKNKKGEPHVLQQKVKVYTAVQGECLGVVRNAERSVMTRDEVSRTT